MAKMRAVVLMSVEAGADLATLPRLKRFYIEEFVPAEREAPGLISIEVAEKHNEAVPHEEENDAWDFAFIELWDSAGSHHQWWTGDKGSPKSDRIKAFMKEMNDILKSSQGKFIHFEDHHYSVLE